MSQPTLDPEAYERLLEITGGDLEFLDELVDTYLSDATAQLAAMREAAAGGDPAAIVRPAHTLKSSSTSVGAMALAERCRTLEADGRAGQVDDVIDRVAGCEQEFADVREALAAVRVAR